MQEEPPLYSRLAAAYVRGKLTPGPEAPPLDALGEAELQEIIRLGREEGLRLHRFKRTLELARVSRVLKGMARGSASSTSTRHPASPCGATASGRSRCPRASSCAWPASWSSRT
ncbi:MAG: hypothetical protein ACJ76Y_29470 [Thermoanaerobaculia bacterium]